MLLPSQFGPLVLLWAQTAAGPRVVRLLLPADGGLTEEGRELLQSMGNARASPPIRELARDIDRFLEGHNVSFPLAFLALDRCSPFQQRVLQAEHAIPRGWVSTYGRIARHLQVPGGARAVGRALATNPFPILIPCHRAIRSDGTTGGYRGGRSMKRALLAMEGVEVSMEGKVSTDRLYY